MFRVTEMLQMNAAIIKKEGSVVCLFFAFVFGEFAAPKVDIDGIEYRLANPNQSCTSLCASYHHNCLSQDHGMDDSKIILSIFAKLLGFECREHNVQNDYSAQPGYESAGNNRGRCLGYKNLSKHFDCGITSKFLTHHMLCPCQKSMCKMVLMLEKVRNKALRDNVIESYLVVNEAICQVKCMQHDFCVSYNFGPHQKNQHICEISSSDGIRSPQQMALRKGFIYQGTKNPCSIAECLKNQSCLPLHDSNSYQCVCPTGYHGDKCEQDIDECDTAAGIYNCAFNSICTNSIGSYKCTCKLGFFGSGKICTDVDECASSEANNCHVDAKCLNTDGSYFCSCKDGYLGDGVKDCCPARSCVDIAENDPLSQEIHLYELRFEMPVMKKTSCFSRSQSATRTMKNQSSRRPIGRTLFFTSGKRSYGKRVIFGAKNGNSSIFKMLERSADDGKYTLIDDEGNAFQVFCLMSGLACSGKGWTLVMRLNNDASSQLKYKSGLWNDNNTFQLDAINGLHNLRETKTAAYWSMPFTKICLGMKTDQERFIEISYNASSFSSVVGSGKFSSTNATRASWLSLVNRGLQKNCNKQGFNVVLTWTKKARVGIFTNNENDCFTCDSWIVFGASRTGCHYSYLSPSSCYILIK